MGYLGPAGTFSAEAANAYVARVGINDAVMTPFRTIADVMLGVAAGEADLGVVPAENSTEGSVAITLDYLVHEVQLNIVGEVIVPVRHNLLALPGAQITEIRTVLSHPQALAQCRRHMQALLPGVEQRSSNSTAEAVRLVSEGGTKEFAAIGTTLAAELYGLTVLQHDMQDTNTNATRFVVVGHTSPARTGNDKTSVVFAFASDQPGNLFRALREFAVRNINLTKLESRPAKRSLGDYIFFADLTGHCSDGDISAALAGLNSQCAFVRVLGSYPMAQYGISGEQPGQED